MWPKYEAYCYDKKYQKICLTIGLKCDKKEDAKDVLADAVIKLGKEIGIDMNLCSIIPNEEEFMSKIEELSYLAYEDQCTPANPREPLVSDMMDILNSPFFYIIWVNKLLESDSDCNSLSHSIRMCRKSKRTN